ncbi:MAG: hypothetical protein JXR63_09620 [Spirochaetales bacterium]|nr:hypothetical protein [Spirochaetales bacterium]
MKKNMIFLLCCLLFSACIKPETSVYVKLDNFVDLSGAKLVTTYEVSDSSRSSEAASGFGKIMEDGRLIDLFENLSDGDNVPPISSVIVSPSTDDLFLVFDSNSLVLGGVNFPNFVRVTGSGDILSVFPLDSDSTGRLYCNYSLYNYPTDFVQFDEYGDMYFIASIPGKNSHLSGLVKYSLDEDSIEILTPRLSKLSLDSFAISADSSKLILSGQIDYKASFIHLYDTNDMRYGYQVSLYYEESSNKMPFLFSKDSKAVYMNDKQIFIDETTDEWTTNSSIIIPSSLPSEYYFGAFAKSSAYKISIKGADSTEYAEYQLDRSSLSNKKLEVTGADISSEDIVNAIREKRAKITFDLTDANSSRTGIDVSFDGDKLIEFLDMFEVHGYDLSFFVDSYSADKVYDIINGGLVRDIDYSEISFDGLTGEAALKAFSERTWFAGSKTMREFLGVEDIAQVITYLEEKNIKSHNYSVETYSYFYDESGALWANYYGYPVRIFTSAGVKDVKVFDSIKNAIETQPNRTEAIPYKISGNNIFFKVSGEDSALGTHKILMCSMVDQNSSSYVDVLKNVPSSENLQIVDFSVSDGNLYFTGLVNFSTVVSGSVNIDTLEFKPFETACKLKSIQVYNPKKKM